MPVIPVLRRAAESSRPPWAIFWDRTSKTQKLEQDISKGLGNVCKSESPQDSHGTRGEPTLASCPLNSIYMYTVACVQIEINTYNWNNQGWGDSSVSKSTWVQILSTDIKSWGITLYCHNGTRGQRQVGSSLAGQLGKMANSGSMSDLSQTNEAEVNRGRQPGLALASTCALGTFKCMKHTHTLNALSLTSSQHSSNLLRLN